ncbi:hypothetical protein HII36_51105 [Nonomuraea sp. NN258]|uniref:hypothetical protein n=1 Tax=Nonomuraea antri TaxID=2730852 RepID=UPI00156A34B2|nr:hypothetical protein [Nonomuraea antri]NRQ40120.1 hypothetical protein [Nonomuraea antri]
MPTSATPPPPEMAAVLVLYALAALTGTALGALTSRPILPSPALSIMALLLGFLVMLLVSASPLYWLTVPLLAWMKTASAGALPAEFPQLAAITLA